LRAAYRSLADTDAAFSHIEPKPAFYLGRSSPHPRLPPGPFEVTWSGVLTLKETAPITFHAFTGGEVTMKIDGVTVLEGRGPTDSSEIGPKEAAKRPPGDYRLTIHCRALADVPARLRLFWERAQFQRDPRPP